MNFKRVISLIQYCSSKQSKLCCGKKFGLQFSDWLSQILDWNEPPKKLNQTELWTELWTELRTELRNLKSTETGKNLVIFYGLLSKTETRTSQTFVIEFKRRKKIC